MTFPFTFPARTFAALSIPNYRHYFTGQSISLVGTWMQIVAQGWLVFTLTHSPTALGLVVALQTIPVLFLGPYGGVIADRIDKRRLMVVLQTLMGLQALALGILVLTNLVTFWEICLLAILLGLNNTFENPARQAFVYEMVGETQIHNAVSLSSTMQNVARAVGPALAGILIATTSIGICFLLNAASFVAVVVSLLTLNPAALQKSKPISRAKGQLREGFKYIASVHLLLIPLLMMSIVGMLAYEFQVVLPVLAVRTFGGTSTTFGYMTAAIGVGAIAGGLVTATRGTTGLHQFSKTALVFGLAILLASLAPNPILEYFTLLVVGYTSVTFLATGISTLQLASKPSMRGRVMALWSVAFFGTTPIGGPAIGFIISATNARVGLATGGLAAILAGTLGFFSLRQQSSATPKFVLANTKATKNA